MMIINIFEQISFNSGKTQKYHISLCLKFIKSLHAFAFLSEKFKI